MLVRLVSLTMTMCLQYSCCLFFLEEHNIWKLYMYIEDQIWGREARQTEIQKNKLIYLGITAMLLTVTTGLVLNVFCMICCTGRRSRRSSLKNQGRLGLLTASMLLLITSVVSVYKMIVDTSFQQLAFLIIARTLLIVLFYSKHVVLLSIGQLFKALFIIFFILSIPWEFVRLYQAKVAEKIALSSAVCIYFFQI